MIEVVVFTGGRGSDVLSRRLLSHPEIRVTLAVNGYDDGASTGEVRRFLGDALGPSDFRKNASRAAQAKRSCSEALVQLLDARIRESAASEEIHRCLDRLSHGLTPCDGVVAAGADLCPDEARRAGERLAAFLDAWATSDRTFRFPDCAIGNLVFAGSYLRCRRSFNEAIDDYCALLGLPTGLLENVTDGSNAYLVALDVEGGVLSTEEAIVDSRRANRIADIFLIDRALSAVEIEQLSEGGPSSAQVFFAAREARPALNGRFAKRVDNADVIVYAPGTQHSSLFPSYLTPHLSDHIAGNLRAVKLLVTNLRYDAEIAGASAVSLVERALFYLSEKGARRRPSPCLITHYLLNDPSQAEDAAPYVPLGQLKALEDPRLVRIGYFEDGVSGRHNAAAVFEPFIESLLARPTRPRVGVLLYGTRSINKLAQTLLEMARGQTADGPCDIHVHVPVSEGFDPEFLGRLPYGVSLHSSEEAAADAVRERIQGAAYGFVGLFESSGMYSGEDLVGLMRYLRGERLDSVWGSRRLSLRDIEESFRRHDDRGPLGRAMSRIGSHVLSMAYLLLYGRHVSDTLSGSRIVRAADAGQLSVPLTHRLVNQHLLSRLLRRRAELLEVPVQFLPLSPKRARRTGVGEGFRSLATIIWSRIG